MRGTQVHLRRRGILSLRFDVLIRIVELTVENISLWFGRSELDPLINTLSRVCRLFRAVVLSTVALWTEIDVRYCLRDDFSELMPRSKRAPLRINIGLKEGNWRNVLSRILPYKDRWRRLKVRFLDGLSVEDVMKAFPGIYFPGLEEVEVSCDGGSQVACEPLFTEWSFRSVTLLQTQDLVPPGGCMPNLRSLNIHSEGVDTDEKVSALFKKLVEFLDCTRSLETLEFDACGITADVPEHLPIVELPNIKKFQISNWGFDVRISLEPYVFDAMSLLARSVKVPNVQEYIFRIHFELGEDSEGRARLESIMEFILSFTSASDALYPVTELAVSCLYEIANHVMVHFFSLFRDLRKLDVDVPYFGENFLLSEDDLNLEHLQSLALEKESNWFLRNGPKLIFNRLCANPKEFTVDLHEDEEERENDNYEKEEWEEKGKGHEGEEWQEDSEDSKAGSERAVEESEEDSEEEQDSTDSDFESSFTVLE